MDGAPEGGEKPIPVVDDGQIPGGDEMRELQARFDLLLIHNEFAAVQEDQGRNRRGVKQQITNYKIVPVSDTDAPGGSAEIHIIGNGEIGIFVKRNTVFIGPGSEKIGRCCGDSAAGAFALNPGLAEGCRIRKVVSVKDVVHIGRQRGVSQAFRRNVNGNAVKCLGALEIPVHLEPQLKSELLSIGVEAYGKVILRFFQQVKTH